MSVSFPLRAQDDLDRAEFQRELESLASVPAHKNVVELLGVCPDAPARQFQCNSPAGLLLEYMDRGCLHAYIHARQVTAPKHAASNAPTSLFPTWRHLNLRQRTSLAMEAAQGLRALHKHGVVHRDVKVRRREEEGRGEERRGRAQQQQLAD